MHTHKQIYTTHTRTHACKHAQLQAHMHARITVYAPPPDFMAGTYQLKLFVLLFELV